MTIDMNPKASPKGTLVYKIKSVAPLLRPEDIERFIEEYCPRRHKNDSSLRTCPIYQMLKRLGAPAI